MVDAAVAGGLAGALIVALVGTFLYLKRAREQETVDAEKAELAMDRIHENLERGDQARAAEEAARMSPRKPRRVPLTETTGGTTAARETDEGELVMETELEGAGGGGGGRSARQSPRRQRKARAQEDLEERARKQRKEERQRERERRRRARDKKAAAKAKEAAKKKKQAKKKAAKGGATAEAAAPAPEAAAPAAPLSAAAQREIEKRREEWAILLDDLEIPQEHGKLLLEFRIKVSDLSQISGEELAELVPHPASCRKLLAVTNKFLRA